MSLERALRADDFGARPRIDPEAGVLVGGRCAGCGMATWPRRAVCPRCGSDDIDAYDLPPAGTLKTWARVWVPVEGLPPPYDVGLVELGGVQVFGHVRGLSEEDVVPLPVTLRLAQEGSGGVPFWFEPATGG